MNNRSHEERRTESRRNEAKRKKRKPWINRDWGILNHECYSWCLHRLVLIKSPFLLFRLLKSSCTSRRPTAWLTSPSPPCLMWCLSSITTTSPGHQTTSAHQPATLSSVWQWVKLTEQCSGTQAALMTSWIRADGGALSHSKMLLDLRHRLCVKMDDTCCPSLYSL